MFTLQSGTSSDGIARRRWLQMGGLSALGLSSSALLQQQAAAGGRQGKARSCIVLLLLGGPPQHETWDPKPDAPIEIRGDRQPIASATPGFWVGDLMPQTARLTDKISVLRAVSTGDNAHSTSGYAMCTGVAHQPLQVEGAKPGAPNDWPNLGAVTRRLRQTGDKMPAAVTLPEVAANDGGKTWPGQSGGWLGRAADPWQLHCDPAADDFQIPGLKLPAGVSPKRMLERKNLLQQLGSRLAGVHDAGALDGQASWHRQAFELLSSSDARQAFDLSQESDGVRDRYGRHTFGQSVLLARRLVEAGVSLIQVNWTRIPGALNNGHWDTHQKNSEALEKYLMPRMDQTYSALLEDLSQRGMLDDTLVVWMGEFGRTPRINNNGGRDHWGKVFSVALAGGGVQGGSVYGASDRLGASPQEGLVTPADFTATVFHALGYSPDTMIYDPLQRPLPISRGKPVTAIF